MFSIVIPTIRPDGAYHTLKSIDYCIKDLERPDIYVGCPTEIDFTGIRCNPTLILDDFKGGKWTLNRIYNRLISQCKGEWIISWQDWTAFDPKGLRILLDFCQDNPNAIVSVLGDKCQEGEYERTVWEDPRRRVAMQTFEVCPWTEIEFNFCIFPKRAWQAVGGFDEGADFEYLGMDGFSVVDRLRKLGGYSFYLMSRPSTYSVAHGRVANWDRENGITGGYLERRDKLISLGQWPIIKNDQLTAGIPAKI